LLASINNLSLLASPCRYTNSDVMILGSFYCMHCPFYPGVLKSAEHLFAACSLLLELRASLLPALSPFSCATTMAESFGGTPLANGQGGQWHCLICLE
jgi:hypothetical protein